MKAAEIPTNERGRLRELARYAAIDSPSEPTFDTITRLVVTILKVPIAFVSIMDRDRQWFKSRHGLDATYFARDVSFCDHVVASAGPLFVPDASKDERFFDHPLVTGDPRIGFYAGCPLLTSDGFVLGTLAAVAHEPRAIAEWEKQTLELLARQAMVLLEMARRCSHRDREVRDVEPRFLPRDATEQGARHANLESFRKFFDLSPELLCTVNPTHFELLNPAWEKVLGWNWEELRSRNFLEFLHPDDVERTRNELSRLLGSSGETVTFENRCRHKNGNFIVLEWSAVAKEGQVFAAVRDVTLVRSEVRARTDGDARLRAIFETAVDAIVTVDQEGTIEHANPAVLRVFGYSPLELVGRPVARLMASVDESHQGFHLKDYLATGTESSTGMGREVVGNRKDGTQFAAEIVVSQFSMEGRRKYTGIVRDIEARKAIERELRQFKLTLDRTRDGLFIIEPNSLRFVYVNQGASIHTGYTVDELLELTPLDLKPLYTEASYRELLAPLVTGEVPALAFETIHRHKDGHGIPVEVLLQYVGSPGESPRFVNIVRDVSERKRSEELSRSVLGVMAEGVVVQDRTGALLNFNPSAERILGLSRGSSVEPPWFPRSERVVREDGRPFPRDEHPALVTLRTGQPMRDVVMGIGHPDGSLRWVVMNSEPLSLTAYDGLPDAVVSTFSDVTERRRLETMKSEFVSTVSHELRTPLTSIRGALGLVSKGITGKLEPKTREFVDIALSNTERLSRLIDDILDIEKIRAGKINLRLQLIRAGELIRRSIEANRHFATAYSVALNFVDDEEDVEILADEDRLLQVFANLISNAVKFSPSGGRVELRMKRVEKGLRVSVRDDGPGIAPEFRSRIFERFAQEHSSDRRRKGGTGLGLSISKALVDAMKGTMGFDTALGEGTTFYLELPVVESPEGVEGEESGANVGRALVCTDDLSTAHLLRTVLEGSHLRVHLAPTLERARRCLEAYSYELLVLDPMLAEGNGPVLVEELREGINEGPSVLMLSGTRASRTVDRLDVGVHSVVDILSVPIEPERLRRLLQRVPRGARPPQVLFFEEDKVLGQTVRATIPDGWSVDGVDTLSEAKRRLDAGSFDLVLLDGSTAHGSGESLLERVGATPVVLFAPSNGDTDLARRVAQVRTPGTDAERALRDRVRHLLDHGAWWKTKA